MDMRTCLWIVKKLFYPVLTQQLVLQIKYEFVMYVIE